MSSELRQAIVSRAVGYGTLLLLVWFLFAGLRAWDRAVDQLDQDTQAVLESTRALRKRYEVARAMARRESQRSVQLEHRVNVAESTALRLRVENQTLHVSLASATTPAESLPIAMAGWAKADSQAAQWKIAFDTTKVRVTLTKLHADSGWAWADTLNLQLGAAQTQLEAERAHRRKCVLGLCPSMKVVAIGAAVLAIVVERTVIPH